MDRQEEFNRFVPTSMTARSRRRPDQLLSRYFEARLLMKVEPERSKKTLDEIMARQPGFVWPHLDLVELESLPGRRDPGPIE